MASFRSRNLPRNSSSESSDNSSDDEAPWKRRCDVKTKNDEPFENPLAGQQPNVKKMKFNVWSNVLTDQVVTGELGNFDIVEEKRSDTLVARDVESYRVTAEAVEKLYPGVDTSRYKDLDAHEDGDGMDTDKEEEGEDDGDDFSKMLNSYKKAKDEWKNMPEDLREKLKNKKRKNDLRGRINKNKFERENQSGGDFVYTSEAKFQTEVPRANVTDAKEVILKCLMDTLEEQNEELFQMIVDNISQEKALELLNKTEDVENSGGMMIKSGLRKRSPGGVFIQLLRNDPIATPELLKLLFPPQVRNKEADARRKKEAKRRRKRTAKAKIRDGEMQNLLDIDVGMETGEVVNENKSENCENMNEDKNETETPVVKNENEDSGAEDGEIVSD